MNSLIKLGPRLAVAAILFGGVRGSATTPVPVGPNLLREGGDCLDDEVLAWQRLRAERTVVIEGDDSAVMACRDVAGTVYVATGSGRLRVSADGGRTFGPPLPVTVLSNPTAEVRAVGVLRNGRVLVAASGKEGGLAIVGSDDQGKTWQAVAELAIPRAAVATGPLARIVQLADGSLLLPVAEQEEKGSAAEGFVYGSSDDGKTWTRVGSLGLGCTGANLLQLTSGTLLAAISQEGARQDVGLTERNPRTPLLSSTVVARSADGGKTWHDVRGVTRLRETPADLAELPDGTVMLTYGQQTYPYGARAISSADGGRTWGPKVYVLGFSSVWADWYAGAMFPTAPGWYVSSVALADGEILSLYSRGSLVLTEQSIVTDWYKSHGKLGEKGKAIIAVRWTLAGMRKPALSFPGVVAAPDSAGYLNNGRCLIKPEHLNEGGDYLHQDEILVFTRTPGEHRVMGPGSGPIVCLDPRGNPVVAAQQGQIYRSTDRGRSWAQISQVPVPGDGQIESLGILRDGTMLVGRFSSSPSRVSVLRSGDGGTTWSAPISIDPSPFDWMGGANCYRINQLPEGTVLMTCGFLANSKLGLDGSWDGVFRSRDGGTTWGDFSYICRNGSETNLLRLTSGRMLAATRYQGPRMADDFILMDDANTYRIQFIKNVSVAVSEDQGYTWSPPRTVTRYFECPGDLVEMKDGTIVLSYNQKNVPFGPRAMVSRDQAKTWDSTLYMLGWWASSGGHTSSVRLKEGRILTVGCGDGQLQSTLWKPLPAR